MIDLKTAAARAADWLEANPDNHIARTLATDADGNRIRPDDDNAVCFCALGRLGKELGVEFAYVNDYGPFLALFPDKFGDIYEANDEDTPVPPDRSYIRPVRPEGGINALRALAKDS